MTLTEVTQGLAQGVALLKPKTTKAKESAYRHTPFFCDVASGTPDAIIWFMKTDWKGLSPEVVEDRLAEYGLNEIAQEKHQWQRQLFKTLVNPFIILLSVLAIVSYFTDDLTGALVMAFMVVISVFLTFSQEFRSTRAAERLKAMVSTSATAIRQTKQEIPISQLVPGDLIHLSAGDMIPADVRILASKDLFVSQAALTGESLPVEKFSTPATQVVRDLLELKNIGWMGSNVVSGTATAVILKTGKESYFGAIAKSLASQRVLTSFDKGINRFTWLMLRFMFVMVPLVFIINGVTKGNWTEAFMFAVAVAVGLTPEMLPMIVTVNLAKGALAMSKKKVIVKRLNSIQNFGAMDVLCTDKTGTLTENRVVLEKYVDPLGNKNDRVLKYAYINSFYQTGLKNLLDVALLKHIDLDRDLGIAQNYRKVDEIPFDFNRKRMSVVVERIGKNHILVCKGALEEMFKISSHAEVDRELVPIEDVSKTRSYQVAQELNEDGLRVIAVAYKEVPAGRTDYSVQDEKGLTLLGFIAFLDPPKETSAQAILALSKTGVTVKVLTGDNDRVTKKICKEVGLSVDHILLGHEVELMSDQELAEASERTTVFAKLTPSQKQRIVHAMHAKGHVVGFLGDGINDAPALKAADVGISVDNAVDIAKESADMILLEKDLLVLEAGVLEGRKVFGNIVKYIKMGASSNFGNVFSVLGASSILPFLPMQPVQLLTQNLLYDLSQTSIPFDNVDKEYLERPRKWEIGDIGRFMLFIGPISSIFDYATFALMWFLFKANSPQHASLFQSGWFVEGLLSQTLVVHMIRTRRIPFIQSRASTPMLVLTAVVMAVGVYVPFSALGARIGLMPLPLSYFPYLALILVMYCFLTQGMKTWFIRKYGYN